MSPVLSSQSMVLATAMAAVSGATVILLAFNRLQKSTGSSSSSSESTPHFPLQSCIVCSDDGKKREERKKKKKMVHFAEDVVDPIGNSDEYRKLHTHSNNINTSHSIPNSNSIKYSKNNNPSTLKKSGKVRDMPANRMALYNGILRDRVAHRVAYSH